jgi:hypothetical protein
VTAGCAITIVGGGSIQRQVPPGLAIATGILTLAFVVSLSGCASLAARPDPRVAEWQAMADATAKAYGKWFTPRVVLTTLIAPNAAYLEQGPYIYLHPSALGSPHLRAVMAHELGHYVQSRLAGAGPLRYSQEQRELDANAEGVRVLIKLGTPESDALREMYEMLAATHRREQAAGRLSQKRGHTHGACVEIRDLLGRFPSWRAAITPEPEISECLPSR